MASIGMHRQVSHFQSLHESRSGRVPHLAGRRTTILAPRPLNRPVLVRAAETREEIDPFTGQTVSPEDVTATIPGFEVTAGNLRWRYRKISPEAGKVNPKAKPVLLLHGIGSNSYTWRSTMLLLSALGYEAYAPDWPGSGSSEKPAAGSKFDYSADAYVQALKAFVKEVGITTPFCVVVQGFVLGQYGLLYALEDEPLVDRLLILNTPLSTKSKLRPELAPYKSPLPFLRPGNKRFAADVYMATGSPFEFQYRDAMVFQRPYDEEQSANDAMAATMEALDWGGLLKRVDGGFRSWRKPALLLFGSADPFIDLNNAFEFLDNMRTCMRLQPMEVKLGHNPQEDDPVGVIPFAFKFLNGELDDWKPTADLLKIGDVMSKNKKLIDK